MYAMYAMYGIRACESTITMTVKSQSGMYFPGPGIIPPFALGTRGKQPKCWGGSRSAANKLEKLTSLKRDKGRAGGVKAVRSPEPRRGGDTQQVTRAGREERGARRTGGRAGVPGPYPRETRPGFFPPGCFAF